MSFENRGRHKKGKGHATGKTVLMPNKFTAEGAKLRKQWEALSLEEREVWGYKFEDYREGKEMASALN